MLVPIITLALVASATFDSKQTIEYKTTFYSAQVNGQYARVKALKSNAKQALDNACRKALTLPERNKIKIALARKLNITLPDSVYFMESELTDYKQEKQEEWLVCTGKVTPADTAINEAGLAITAAWWISEQQDKTNLRPLLKVAMSHPSTMSDAVALAADQSPQNERIEYLDKYLVAEELKIDAAKVSVAQVWLNNQRYKQVLSLMEKCESVDCKRLSMIAQAEYEQRTADDLSSYF